MGVSPGVSPALDLLQIAVISPSMNSAKAILVKYASHPSLHQDTPFGTPSANPSYREERQGCRVSEGPHKASFGPSRARARVYRALALGVVGGQPPHK